MRFCKVTFVQGISILLLASLTTSALSACTGLFAGKLFKERASETPAPDDYATDKSFFVNSDGKPKTFLCAWAPEIARGSEAYTTPFVNEAPHCNIEFEITEQNLIGRIVNPSFLDDRARWKQMLQIPITKHYYFERDKDPHGRETNVWIENSSRSHWSARPKMKLDLSRIQIFRFTSEDDGVGESIVAAHDIEWDIPNNFLGFSIDTSWHDNDGTSLNYQGAYRINFMKFDHDPTFKKVPFHQDNARYMNILHVLGRRIEGIENDLYAGHWDIRKTNRIYISGATDKHIQDALVSGVWKWNYELRKIGAIGPNQVAFAPVIKTLNHPFDLRYPSITWIDDRRISLSAPLGIGMAHADVRNGQILWGGIVLFGGMLEKYINSYAPVDSGSSSTAAGTSGATAPISPLQTLAALFPASAPPAPFLGATAQKSRADLLQSISVDHKNYLSSQMLALAHSKNPADQQKIQALRTQATYLQAQDPGLNKIVADLSNEAAAQSLKAVQAFAHTTVQNILGATSTDKAPDLAEVAQKTGHTELANIMKQTDATKRAAMLKQIAPAGSAFFAEEGLSIENLNGSMMASPAQTKRTYPEMLDSVVASLIVHEFGHVVGLGHQFKENIIPEDGVPSRFIKDLLAKATAEKEFTNFTSVMGYQSGRTEMMTPAEQYVPGPHDDLVMRYLYKGEYSVYDPDKDDFVYVQLPPSGKIPDYTQFAGRAKPLHVAYFPQCNDYEASLGADPFCNRWDRGNSAVDIVNNYFQLISDNLLGNLYSVSGGGSYPEYAENRLWGIALDTFSRVRLFYDEMRRLLRSDPHLAPDWNIIRNNTDVLFLFSKACNQPDPTDIRGTTNIDPEALAALTRIFKHKNIVDLCRANTIALKEFSFFLNLPQSDYTKIDPNNRYSMGGFLAGDVEQNQGHFFGSWYEMTNMPLKFSAMYTLTAANPYLLWDGWLLHNPYYDNEENRFLYRTLYPIDYTKTISETVQNNMRFAATGKDDRTILGRTVLVTGEFLPWQRYTGNDSALLPSEFNDMLDQQTQFKYGMVAVLIDAVKPDGTSNVAADHYKKFTATIYDFFTGKSSTATDVYLLPDGRVFVRAPGMFLFPTTKIKFYQGTSSYVIAYNVNYDEGPRDDLAQAGLKRALTAKHDEIADDCVKGVGGNGLEKFFDTAGDVSTSADGKVVDAFSGFNIPADIAQATASGTANEQLGTFYDSLTAEFAKFEAAENAKIPPAFPIRSMRRVCEEAVRGIGQISAAAAMANGYWLGITDDYLEH